MTGEKQFRRVQWDSDEYQASDDDADGMPLSSRGSGIAAADLELLTLAASAIGAQVEIVDGEDWVNLHYENGMPAYGWNSLLFGDDTLNLAVDLNLDVFQAATDREARAVGPLRPVVVEPWGDDKRAATRRAITRAAADIAVARKNKRA